MANIVKRNEGQSMEGYDPFRMMREMMRWDPFREIMPLATRGMRDTFEPTFDVRESNDAFVVEADLPGIKPEDVEVTLTGNRLSIQGKREINEEARNDTYYCSERFYGSFTRTFTLPEGTDADHARSDFRDGVLKLVIPKKPEAQPRRIALQSGKSKA